MPETHGVKPGLLSLPSELLSHIYSYLLPHTSSTTPHPLPDIAITSVSPSPPPLSALLIHPLLTSTLLQHYYGLATWKLVLSHSFNFFRTDPELDNLAASAALKQFRRVEIVFFLDILLVQEYPSFRLEAFAAEIRRRADRACDVLGLATELRYLTVSWMDTTCTEAWESKKSILEPLRKLRGMEVEVGEVRICGLEDDVEQERKQKEAVVRALRGVVGYVKPRRSGSTEEKGEAVRLLEVDVSQQRCERPGNTVDVVRLP